MHIVHVPRRFTPAAWGGTETVLSAMLPLQRAAGSTVSIHTTTALDTTPHSTLASDPVITIHRHGYMYPEWPLAPERRARYDRKGGNLVSFPLAQQLQRLAALSLIHCHTGNRLAAQCLRVARRRHIPCVVTLHGGHFAIPTAEHADLQVADGPRGRIPWGKGLSMLWRTRQLLHDVDAVICVGLDEYNAARAALPEQRVIFLPGGVDHAHMASGDRERGRRHIGATGQRPLLICPARLDHQKDQATLVRAWSSLPIPCDLALIGPETSPGLAEQLRSLGAGGPGQLLLPGAVAPAAMPDCYAAADAVVLPSRHEPFGLACLEAWAAKRALIASDTGGPGWLLADDRCGWRFPVGDAAHLRHCLLDVLSNPVASAVRVAAGHQRSHDEFSWLARHRALTDLYQTCIDAGRHA